MAAVQEPSATPLNEWNLTTPAVLALGCRSLEADSVAPDAASAPQLPFGQRDVRRGDDGRREHTVQQIADEFGVTRPMIYRRLQRNAG
jgi:hypothetical protein